MNIRVGFGYDVHKLVENRDLWLGGIKIDYELGLLGHSDADVLIHAICDALLGAANMRDIGYHFPDTAAETLNVDSKILLKKTMDLIACHEGMPGKSDGCRGRPDLHQGYNHREVGLYRKNGRNLGLRYSIDSKSLMRVKISLFFDEISNNSLIYIKKSQK